MWLDQQVHGAANERTTSFRSTSMSPVIAEIPLKRWGKVIASNSLRASEVHVEPAEGGSLLVLLREGSSAFDPWCESMADAERLLRSSTLDWQRDVSSKP